MGIVKLAIKQMEMAGEYPDILIGCTGGGSNFGGFAFPFIHQNLTNGANTRVITCQCVAPNARLAIT